MINENEFFRQATFHLFSSLDIEIALQRLFKYIKAYLPADGIVLGLYEPQVNTGRVLASIFPEDLKKPPGTITFPPQLWDWFSKKWKEVPEILCINDIDTEPPEMKKAITLIWPQNASHLFMDLELENKRLGTFTIFVKGKYQYNDSHAKLISLIHDPMTSAISNVLKHLEILRLRDLLEDDNEYLSRRLLEMTGDTIIGADFGLSSVIEMVRKVAPMNSPVLLMGETGVGKEVIANAIHNASGRKGRPMIKVNCGAIPESLIDSELFGHEKGAFTGAISLKRGLFERADTGTIFLDEVGELPLSAQVRLLRVLQEKEIERVGGTKTFSIDVRIISATHRNLEQMVENGKFREDLWYRINVFPIIIPPLRQRPEDVPA
ncbi:MAG: sigma 54-interacting transcriptional regulator, partial [Proteobacteria bacterium]|nr:sigma 54-interacting transcriptional regulator [Pseudomonadota bacterium]